MDRGAGPEALPDPDAERSVVRRHPTLTVAAIAVVGLVVAAAAWGVSRLPSIDVPVADPALPHAHGPILPLPEPGDVLPALLQDGSPAFVVRHEDGSADVVGAVSPHAPAGGSQKALAWCPSSRWFEDLQHGSKFSEWGAYVGGPAPTGLVRYAFRRDGAGAIVVGEALAAPGRGAGRESQPAGPSCTPGGARQPVVHTRGDVALPSPRALAANPEARWRPAEAAVMSGDGAILICDVDEVFGDRCPQTALRVDVPEHDGGGRPHIVSGTVLLWIAEDEVRPPILLAETAGG